MLETLFNPSSIAIIGASRNPGKVGYEVLHNIITSGYKGTLYPINPKADNILDLKCYSSVLHIPEAIDLGIVIVPAKIVPTIVQEAGEKGIENLIVISSGFKESGREGSILENQIVKICRKYRLRLLGPNCLGIIDTHTPLNASFAGKLPQKGNIAFISQSGALGTAILDWALEEQIGFSKFISLGNKADIVETDLLQTLKDDEVTRVILIYLEGLKEGLQFIEIAQEITRDKPIIVLKSGTTSAGVRAVSSHTGTMAGIDLAYDVAFKHANVIRVNTTEELFSLAKAFSTQPLPQGQNVAIITNAGGPGILATDACGKYGLKMAPIPANTVEILRNNLPSAAGFFNPIDVLGDASADRYRWAIKTIMKEEVVHNSLIILTPQAMTQPIETAKTIIALRKKFSKKPIVTSFLGGSRVKKAIDLLEATQIPNYEFPEKAVQALHALYEFTRNQTFSHTEKIPQYDVDRKTVSKMLQTVVDDRRAVLKAFEAIEVVNAYGIPTPPLQFAATAEEAMEKADQIGYPIVLKIESPQILHKTDIGGIKLNIQSADEVRTSFYELIGRAHTFHPRATILGVNVQKMISSGREMIVGMNRDMIFGPLIMFGLGGIYVNFLEDVSFKLAPLSRESAVEMIQETKAYTLLRGIRGEASSDIDSVVDIILRMSQLVTDFTIISEMDINPLFVYEKGEGCLALDVKMTIKP